MFVEGTRIGKYELQRELGRGGFGMVFVARDTALDRICALKFLLPEHTARPDLLGRFLQEARSAAMIAHLGIVTIYECGQIAETGTSADGTAFIAMELLHGESLAARLQRGPIRIDHALALARQIASALHAAHVAGIVHRDLKPDNVFLIPDEESAIGERVKVLDFGIAKLAESASAVHTGTLSLLGTPRYMSPEQCRSSADVDARSDVYALGVMLFEMVCGQRPFSGEIGELIAHHQLTPAPAARSLRAEISPELDALIAAMLAKRPDDRPRGMDEVIRRLEDARAARRPDVQIAAVEAPVDPRSATVVSGEPAVPPPADPRGATVVSGAPSAPLAIARPAEVATDPRSAIVSTGGPAAPPAVSAPTPTVTPGGPRIWVPIVGVLAATVIAIVVGMLLRSDPVTRPPAVIAAWVLRSGEAVAKHHELVVVEVAGESTSDPAQVTISARGNRRKVSVEEFRGQLQLVSHCALDTDLDFWSATFELERRDGAFSVKLVDKRRLRTGRAPAWIEWAAGAALHRCIANALPKRDFGELAAGDAAWVIRVRFVVRPKGEMVFARVENVTLANAPAKLPPKFSAKLDNALRGFQIDRCFEAVSRAKPWLEGMARVSFTIRADGRIAEPHLDAFDHELGRCLAQHVGTLSFDAPGSPVEVSAELHFTSPWPALRLPDVPPGEQLSAEAIEAVCRRVAPALTACLGRHSEGANARIEIDARGKVRTSNVDGRTAGDERYECFAKVFDEVTFPEVAGRTRVSIGIGDVPPPP